MTTTDFSATLLVDQTPEEAFNAINNVRGWWSQNVSGNSKSLNDLFSVKFGETFVDFKIVESVSEKKIVWQITDCNLHWLTDKKEWKDTQIVWEIISIGDSTEVVMTHIGLIPEIECFENCRKGWDFFIKESLYKLLTEGKGLPDKAKDARNQ
jgi:hypothetical protein